MIVKGGWARYGTRCHGGDGATELGLVLAAVVGPLCLEYLIRPVERAVASWSDGDGAGMCMRSFWPNVSVSAQVVGVSRRGARGSLGSGRSAGCAIGEDRTSPRLGAMAGIRSGRIPGGLLPLLGSPDRRRHASALPAGFSPARGVINVPPPAPVRVCVCGLVSGVLRLSRHVMHGLTWATLSHAGGVTGLYSESTWVSRGSIFNGVSGCLRGSLGCSGGSSWRLGRVSILA